MLNPDRPELQRLRHQTGEALLGRDFRDQLAIDREMIWWHNRAVHQAVGIVNGLTVGAATAVSGGYYLTVEAGSAYDGGGRALCLATPREVFIPAITGSSSATVEFAIMLRGAAQRRYGSGLRVTGSAFCSCIAAAAAEVAVIPSDCVDPADGIVLALLRLPDDESLDLEPIAARVRPFRSPKQAYGSTVRGATPWTLLPPSLAGRGYQTKIDTASAGFLAAPAESPLYFAQLVIPNSLMPDGTAIPGADACRLHYTWVTDVAFDRFIFQVWFPDSNSLATAQFLSFARSAQIYVAWLGIQMSSSAEPYSSREAKP
ncbi:MAG: hypothetical protein ACH37Z_04210 [Anaerolineae bacterium]